jgi:predicted  nucleic acid-binding Zn-ribbon protein
MEPKPQGSGGQTVRDNLLALRELQQIDTRVLEVERIAGVLPEKIRELESEVEKLRAELGVMNAEVDTKKGEQREIESQISEETGKHKKWRRRLNEIKTPREYQALSREIELGERQVKEFEESVLTIMTEVESKQKVIGEKDGELKQREVEVATKVRELRIRQADLAKDAAAIAVGRVSIIKKLPEPVVKKYEQIRERRNGIAVALVVEGCCQGCNVQLRPQMVVELRKYTGLTTCPTCHRILVPEELIKSEKDKKEAAS